MAADTTRQVRIISRWNSDRVLFSFDVPADVVSGMELRTALESASVSRANLSGANLSGADLSRANLYGANLSGADLYGADLSGADLSRADLSRADLSGANLSGADLSGADLSGADLSRADLSRADLSGANLSGADLSGADLSGADLSGANLSGADLSGADLSGADLSGADLSGADLSGADLSRANLYGADLAEGVKRATPEESIAALDKVGAIILDNADRLDMGHWHDGDEWKKRTCAEEAACETTHCLAGWLQVCATDPKIRELEPQVAGAVLAPIAAKMFFRGSTEVLSWLGGRKYVAELEERAKIDAERAAKVVQS